MRIMLLSLSIIGFAAAPALAQMADFSATDANRDGIVTMEEAKAVGYEWSAEQFAQADLDGDGGLSEAEFAQATAG